MKWAKAMLISFLVVVVAVWSGAAAADRFHHHGHHHHGHARFGVFIGAPLFAPWYYPSPYYYYPPPVVAVPTSPPTYIERGEEDLGSAPQQGYWYFCDEARAYYPYVKECPGGWKKVIPQTPPS